MLPAHRSARLLRLDDVRGLEQLKAGGAPVDWFVCPGATHGRDKPGEGANAYVYREETALDATRRMLAFFDTHK